MTDSCPRCASEKTHVEFEGKENGRIIWTVYNCDVCRFTWRNTEPENTIVHAKRDRFFRLDAARLERIAVHMPPPDR